MGIPSFEEIAARLLSQAPSDYREQMVAQEYKCAACVRDQIKWVTPSEFGPQFTDSILEGAAHELICYECASELRFNMNRAENLQRIRREQELREEYINAQLARCQDD
jgi:hypothetical protein